MTRLLEELLYSTCKFDFYNRANTVDIATKDTQHFIRDQAPWVTQFLIRIGTENAGWIRHVHIHLDVRLINQRTLAYTPPIDNILTDLRHRCSFGLGQICPEYVSTEVHISRTLRYMHFALRTHPQSNLVISLRTSWHWPVDEAFRRSGVMQTDVAHQVLMASIGG